MAKVGQIVIYVHNKLDDKGLRVQPVVDDKHVPLLVCAVHTDGTVDGFIFIDEGDSGFLKNVPQGNPSTPRTFYPSDL